MLLLCGDTEFFSVYQPHSKSKVIYPLTAIINYPSIAKQPNSDLRYNCKNSDIKEC